MLLIELGWCIDVVDIVEFVVYGGLVCECVDFV